MRFCLPPLPLPMRLFSHSRNRLGSAGDKSGDGGELRMQVAGQSLNPRASVQTPNTTPGLFSGFTENKNINGPWLARAAVRELKLHGTDWAKIYTTQDFVGDELREFRPDGSLVAIPSLTLEEVQAIVDESHRMGLKVACHT